MIRILSYDAATGPCHGTGLLTIGPSVFLAGPTTDAAPDGRAEIFVPDSTGKTLSFELSIWRATVVAFLQALKFDGVVIVPEFLDKTKGFKASAAARFGNTPLPPGLEHVSPASLGVLRWEESMMRRCSVVAAWADVRDKQPALGLNARPEIYGLILRTGVDTFVSSEGAWAPRALVLGIPDTATSATRLRLAAYQLGIEVSRTLVHLAQRTAALAGGR